MLNYYLNSYKGLSKDIWLLSLVMFINRSGAMVLPFLSIYLNQHIGLSLTQCGIIMSCYGLGSVAGAFIGGVLTDEIGYYKVMLGSLFATSLSFLVVMNLQGFTSLCLGFFMITFIADLFRPANITAIEAFSKPENLTRSIGLIRLAINLGYAFGPFLGGYIASFMGYNFLFVFNALSVFSAGVVFYYFFRNKKKRVEVSEEEDEHEIKKLPWQDVPYLSFLLFWVFVIIVFFILIYIVPLYYKKELGFDESIVGLLMGLNGLIIFLVEMPLIYFLEKYLKAIHLVVLGSVLIGLGILCFAVFGNPWVASLTFIVFVTFGEILSFPFSNTYALSFANERNRGKYMGIYTMTFSVAHVIAPLSWMKYAESYGFHMLWIVSAGLCLFAAMMIYLTRYGKA